MYYTISYWISESNIALHIDYTILSINYSRELDSERSDVCVWVTSVCMCVCVSVYGFCVCHYILNHTILFNLIFNTEGDFFKNIWFGWYFESGEEGVKVLRFSRKFANFTVPSYKSRTFSILKLGINTLGLQI